VEEEVHGHIVAEACLLEAVGEACLPSLVAGEPYLLLGGEDQEVHGHIAAVAGVPFPQMAVGEVGGGPAD